MVPRAKAFQEEQKTEHDRKEQSKEEFVIAKIKETGGRSMCKRFLSDFFYLRERVAGCNFTLHLSSSNFPNPLTADDVHNFRHSERHPGSDNVHTRC